MDRSARKYQSLSKQQQSLSMAIYYVCPTWHGESMVFQPDPVDFDSWYNPSQAFVMGKDC